MEYEKQLQKALIELRKDKERKFDQTVDLIINLKKFDVKKNQINLLLNVPHKIKEKKIAGFFESENKNVPTITFAKFKKYRDKKELKKLVNQFDFFIAEAKLMPKVATTFGRVLGPTGKMPSPQMGILMDVNDKNIEELKKRINNTLKIKIKEASIKVPVGKQSMEDKDIIENIGSIYEAIEQALPKKKDNVKNISLKFTMTKPQRINVK
jgi:large subunit ribosomal protein L1